MPTCRENFYLGQYELLLVGNKIPTQQLPPHNKTKIEKKPKIKRRNKKKLAYTSKFKLR